MIQTRQLIFLFLVSFGTLSCTKVAAHELADPFIIATADNDIQITLYPNPFRGNLQVDLSSKISLASVEIKFLNLIGKEMDVKFNLPLNGFNDHLELDLKQLPAGVYFMEITTKQLNGTPTKYTRKVTKL